MKGQSSVMFLFRVTLLVYFVVAVSGCKTGAFYAGTAQLIACKGDVEKKFVSEEFKDELGKLNFQMGDSKSHVFEIKSANDDEFGVKLISQERRRILQVVGIDFLPQECGYNKACEITEVGKNKMADVILKIGTAVGCEAGKVSFSDIKKMESPAKVLDKWRSDPSYAIDFIE